jgi:hypothetical protein
MDTQPTEENSDKNTDPADATGPQRILAIPDHKRVGSNGAAESSALSGGRWLWLFPLVFLVGFSIAHELLNRSYRESHGAGPDQNVIEVRASEGNLLQHTGSWSWRFFSWGVRRGTAITTWDRVLLDLGVPLDFARASDPTNPTPFFLFLASLLFPVAGYVVTRGGSDV